jgi:hypothetical protein
LDHTADLRNPITEYERRKAEKEVGRPLIRIVKTCATDFEVSDKLFSERGRTPKNQCTRTPFARSWKAGVVPSFLDTVSSALCVVVAGAKRTLV